MPWPSLHPSVPFFFVRHWSALQDSEAGPIWEVSTTGKPYLPRSRGRSCTFANEKEFLRINGHGKGEKKRELGQKGLQMGKKVSKGIRGMTAMTNRSSPTR